MEHQIRFASERKVLSEDTIFNLEFCRYCSSAATLPDVIYHYVMHRSSHTHRMDETRLQRTLDFSQILKRYAEEFGLAEHTEDSMPKGEAASAAELDAGVERRLQNTIWISVMEMVRQYAQQENGFRQVREFLTNREVQENVEYMSEQPLGRKQKLLCSSIRHRNALAVYWMGRLHS